jgi:hypothetical protein
MSIHLKKNLTIVFTDKFEIIVLKGIVSRENLSLITVLKNEEKYFDF